jgi:hypothetical protein
MRVSRTLFRALVLLAWSAVSLSQEDSPAPPPATPPAAPAPEASADEATPEPVPAGPPGEVDDDTFIPTEELAPDAGVTFPVDI